LAGTIKQRMIERAAILLAKKGLQGTSFSEVLEASGAPRGSLYHHFPGGKEELVLAALGAASDRAMDVLNRLGGRPATDIAQTFFELWRTVLSVSNFGAGCAVVAVTVAADAPVLLESTAEIFRTWRTRLGELLTEGGVPAERAYALSATLIAASEGAVILSRAERSFEPFDLIAECQLAMVRAAMGAASDTSA
jgi:TetR/AcrR family transcriptional regulator, lmrAB and yxaGH operons repressor